MAKIPIPNVAPFWDSPAIEPRKLSTWKQQMGNLIALTDMQLSDNNKLTNIDKNNILYAHLGAEAARHFEHNPAMINKDNLTPAQFYAPLVSAFEQVIPQPVAFHKLRSCKQLRDESAGDFLSLLRVLESVCQYGNLTPDMDLAYCLVTNCSNHEIQKKLFTRTPVSLTSFIAVVCNHQTNKIYKSRNQPQARFNKNHSTSQVHVQAEPTCSNCGCKGHHPKHPICPANNQQCKSCGKLGHFQKKCCSSKPLPVKTISLYNYFC